MENMKVSELEIKGCLIIQPKVFQDSRGTFHEWYQARDFQKLVGSQIDLAQANCSVSNLGVIRGIHYAKYPPGQAKYVTCVSGKVFDVVVDLRMNSITFGKWNSVIIDSKTPTALYIPSGIGHAFMALEDMSVFVYLCDQSYNPNNEFDISPFDKTLNINWPTEVEAILSEKDLGAPSFLDSIKNFSTMIQ